jgi:hypothetical protein
LLTLWVLVDIDSAFVSSVSKPHLGQGIGWFLSYFTPFLLT